MPRGQHSYIDLIKELERKKAKKPQLNEEIEAWRKKYREAGPVRFAEEVLRCPYDVPPHPELGRVPVFIILSKDQKEFLEDLRKRISSQAILAAGRGAGKTFCIAIYVTWRICCFDYFTITVMGGVSEQSIKIKDYVDFWRINDNNINFCIYRSLRAGAQPSQIHSRWGSYARFPGCSEQSARGPHVTQVFLDEVCSGESKSAGGALAIRSARGQIASSAQYMLVYTSTVQYIFGTFLKTWNNCEKFGFKRYRWSTGKYYDNSLWYLPDGITPNWDYIDTVLYKDRNPKHWISNVWWITDESIQTSRKNNTDDEFLVEILGGISRGAGLVFGRNDLLEAICDGSKWDENGNECEECYPYNPEKCPLMKKLGTDISRISNRKMGIDFGDVAPYAIAILGQYGDKIYVLHSEERAGISSNEALEWIDEEAKKLSIFEMFADPEERAMKEALEAKGYSTPNIWAFGGGAKKKYYVVKFKRLIEKHRIVIPKAFQSLITSLSELAYDEQGDIRKHGDHSFDSIIYGSSDYDPDIDTLDFWKDSKGLNIWRI